MESYAYSLKNVINENEKLVDKLSDDEKTTLVNAVNEAISWLDAHADANANQLQERKAQLESKVQPIIGKLYDGNGEDEARNEL